MRPTVLNGIKAVVVDSALKNIEPLAYHFVVDFAKDNDLQVVEACILPDPHARTANPALAAALSKIKAAAESAR